MLAWYSCICSYSMENYILTMNSKSERELSLPDIELIKLNQSTDRFGFSYFLRDNLNIKLPYHSFCGWDQGWYYGNSDVWVEEDFISGDVNKNFTYLTGDKDCKILLNNLGYRNVVMAGLPFCYIDFPKVDRIKNSAIFMLPKQVTQCAHIGKIYQDKDKDRFFENCRIKFIEYINGVKNDFDKVVVCIFPGNSDSEELISVCKKNKLEVVLGANPYDKNALTRMAILFSKFEYSIANGMGSHIIYANIMGAKCCIVDPVVDWHNAARSNIWNDGFSNKYCRKAYPWLYVEHYRSAKNQKKWALRMAGCEFKLDKNNLVKVLGWSILGQIKGFYSVILRRLVRGYNYFSNFFSH